MTKLPARTGHANPELLARVEEYLRRYVTFSSPDYPFAAALYAAGTYLWPHFDAFGYLVITSDTKRSGKSRFAEVLSFVSSNPRQFAGMTPAALFRSIADEKPTIFIDEAESLASEAASLMRTVLNVGYRKGQTIPRVDMIGGGIAEYEVYCPKIFILIGDVYDTLKDRSIVIRMKRGDAPSRFVYEPAKAAGNEIGEALKDACDLARDTIIDRYSSHEGLTFLPDRDEEIWLPLFALCEVLAPDRLPELQRVAVDIATEKTMPVRRYVNSAEAEREAQQDEYGRRLLHDLLTVIGDRRSIFTVDALAALRELPTGPWRKYRGEGLTAEKMSDLLSPFGVAPRAIRVGGKRKNARVARGYFRESVAKAIANNSPQ